MLNTLLAVLGIVVSIVLFIVGYRQTVGAKKERIRACNTEIEKLLLRRIVLEAHSPIQVDVERLVQGKARDFRVATDDLLSVGQIMNTLYTRIVESDVIPKEDRKTILDRIGPALVETESRSAAEIDVAIAVEQHTSTRAQTAVTAMALLASGVGALVAAAPVLLKTAPFSAELLRIPLLTAGASLTLIMAFFLVYKLRAMQETTPNKGDEIERYVRLESQAAGAFRKYGYAVRPSMPNRVGDFIAEKEGKRLLVEVKNWPRRVPARLLAQLAERLRVVATEVGADEVVIVTQAPVIGAIDNSQITGVAVVSVRDIPKYLKVRSESAA